MLICACKETFDLSGVTEGLDNVLGLFGKEATFHNISEYENQLDQTIVLNFQKIKTEIARILKEEGFISNYEIKKDKVQNTIVLNLKYGQNKERVITGLKRISKPGLRVYAKAEEIPKVLNGLGIAIVSTSKGIMTDKNARKESLGGEVLAYIWQKGRSYEPYR